jgi:hypothetical protein
MLASTLGEASNVNTLSAFPDLAARNNASVSGLRVACRATPHAEVKTKTNNTVHRIRKRDIPLANLGPVSLSLWTPITVPPPKLPKLALIPP